MNISGLLHLIRRGGIVAVTATTLMTAGCGGGDDGGSSATKPAAGTDTPQTTPPPQAGANTAPTISGTPATQVNVGAAYTMSPVAADADSDKLAFSVENLPPWAKFNTVTGQLTGTPAAANAGQFANVTISVSDGKASAVMPAFSITVAAAGSAPPAVDPAPVASTPGEGQGAVTLQWTIPTEAVDQTALQTLAGYRVHYGKSDSTLTNAIEVPNASVSTFVVDKLSPGTWYIAIRAVNSDGGSSALSNVLRFVVS